MSTSEFENRREAITSGALECPRPVRWWQVWRRTAIQSSDHATFSELTNRNFGRHIERLVSDPSHFGPYQKEMLGVIGAVQTAFSSLGMAPIVGERVLRTYLGGQLHAVSMSDRTRDICFDATTIPCSVSEGGSYFARTRWGGFVEYVDRLRDPNFRAIYAHLVVLVKARAEKQADFAVQLLVLPNTQVNEARCPVAIWPHELLAAHERAATSRPPPRVVT